MCSPVLVLAGTSMAMTGVGAVQQSNAQKAAGKANQDYYNYVAAQNKINADAAIAVGEQKSNMAQFKGSQDAAKYERDASQFKGLQRATGAAMGIGAGSATSEDIATDTLNKEQLDQMSIRYNADMASWSAKTGAAYEAWDYENQSKLNTMAGVNARKAGKAAATATLIGGATSIMSQGASFSQYSNPVKIQ